MNIPSTMKALVCSGPEQYAVREMPVPVPGEGEILIRTEICGICAGDIKAAHRAARFWGGDGMPGFCRPPFIPGHEFIGHIAAMGENVRGDFQIGDRITTEQLAPCGECWYCRHGMYWLCEPHNVYGFKSFLNGGMAEYVLLPKTAINYHVPEEFTSEQAVLIEPFSCSLHGVRQSGAGPDDTVVLAGAGTLGLGMVSELKRRNVKKLIVLDPNRGRLEKAKQLGADLTIDPLTEDYRGIIAGLTENVGCDVYIEATGHPSAVQQGLDIIRKAGRFVEFSVMSGSSTVDWSIIGDAKEITIIGSQLSPYCVEDTIRGIRDGWFRTDGIVTDVFRLEDWAEAYRKAESGTGLKCAFKF